MVLSKQEINWVDKIEKGKIQNFLDFADDSEFYNHQLKRWIVDPSKQYEFKRYLYNFLALIKKLESERLIYLAEKNENANFGNLVYVDDNEDMIDEYLNDLMSNYGTIEIIPFEEIKTFVTNNYSTKGELALKKEIRDRKISQYLTFTIGAVSIIASVITAILSNG